MSDLILLFNNAGNSYHFSVSVQIKLIPSTRESIGGLSCVVYKLRTVIQLYNWSADYQYTLDERTKIAINSPNNDASQNEFIFIQRKCNEETKK